MRFTHDLAGREVARQLDTTVTLSQTWDLNHQLQSQTLTTGPISPAQPPSAHQVRLLQRRTYTYRPDGHLTRIDDHLAGTRSFTLDPIGQVTTVHGPSWDRALRLRSGGQHHPRHLARSRELTGPGCQR